jgi:hypothetical protein
MVHGIVERLTDDELERSCERSPAPGYPENDAVSESACGS